MRLPATFRLVEEPLGPDALHPPTREEVEALWEQVKDEPVPDYSAAALRRFFPQVR